MKDNHTKFILGERGTKKKLNELIVQRQKRINRFFRPGNRTSINSQEYIYSNFDGFSFLGVIKQVGDDSKNILPIYSHLFPIRILSRECKKINDLQELDFIGAYSFIYDKETLKLDLNSIYNGLNYEEVTIYDILY